MKRKNEQQPIMVCKPRIIWRIYSILIEVVMFLLICYFLTSPTFTGMSNPILLIWLISICLIIMANFILNYPPTISTFDTGVDIQWWMVTQFVVWDEITLDTKHKKSGSLRFKLSKNTKQKPPFQKMVFTLDKYIHSEYDTTTKILISQLS